jgi:hypothetical protein
MCVKSEDRAEEILRLLPYENQQGWASEAQRLLLGATRPKPQSAGK